MPAPAPSEPSLVPRQAQKEIDEANRLIAELNRPSAAPAAARPEWQPATPAAPVPPGVPDSPAPAAQPPGPSPEAVAAAVAAAEPQPMDEEVRRLRAAYQTLQGKYNSEIAGLRSMSLQQGELINQLVAERARPAAPPAAPPTPQSPADIMKSLGATDKEIEDYGELLPIVAKLAQNMFKPTLAKLENELAQLRNQTSTNANLLTKTRQAEVEYDLDQALPNWRVINESQEFLDWLDFFDIMAGTTRRVALASAYKNLDAQRVVGIFQAYVRDNPAAKSASNGPLVPIDTLVTPAPRGDQTVTAPEGASSKRIISEQEIADFYTRVRKKQVSPEEYARYSQEIAVATAEGRIRPNKPDHHMNAR